MSESNATEPTPEVSVVIPCLNEAATIGQCVQRAVTSLRDAGISSEVIVADNGSTDGSREIAIREGARLVPVTARGYGAALAGGIAASNAAFIIMGDADMSYDFGESPELVRQLRSGKELVQGCRLPAGGGTIAPGAMPFLHRVWGNPMFSLLARWWFGSKVTDIYCGLRGFRRSLYDRLDLRCTGMEFATEMIIRASLLKADVGQIPITLHRDGRIDTRPHLRTFRDGWRTLRLFLLMTPGNLFFRPGATLFLLGVIGYALALPGISIGHATLDAHTLLVASLLILCGYLAMWFSVLARTLGVTTGLLPKDERLYRWFNHIRLEHGLLAAFGTILGGGGLLIWAVARWANADFGRLDYAMTMRLVIPGCTLVAGGMMTMFLSFLLSMIGLRQR